jgi:hypothetical protein
VAGSAYQVKGYNVRGFVAAVSRRGLLADLEARATPATRALLVDPPSPSAWVDGTVLLELNTLLLEQRGEAVVRAIGRESIEQGALGILRPAIEGFMRLFGATPSTLFSRLATLSTSSTRGAKLDYTEESATAGLVVFRLVGTPRATRAVFISFAGAMEVAFDLCKVRGTAAEPVVRNEGSDTVGEIRVSW